MSRVHSAINIAQDPLSEEETDRLATRWLQALHAAWGHFTARLPATRQGAGPSPSVCCGLHPLDDSRTSIFSPDPLSERADTAHPAHLPLELLTAEQSEGLLRLVFDLSRQAGLAARVRASRGLELAELMRVLVQGGGPCLQGTWQCGDAGELLLQRAGCSTCDLERQDPQAVALRCDVWREAIDGLVMGAGESARYSRHRSQGHGNPTCEDVLYEAERRELRFGSVSEEVRGALSPLKRIFEESGLELVLEGSSEDQLYYRIEQAGQAPCGLGGQLMHSLVTQAAAKLAPPLKAFDISPRGVLKEGV